MDTSHTLDLRQEAPGTAQLAAIAAVRELPRGHRLVLISAEPPGLLMQSLNVYFRNDLAWEDREVAPGTWRCEVRHRADTAATDVLDLLTRDHKRLDELFARALQLVNAGRVEAAAPLMAEFGEGLRRHVRAENDLLVPAFASRREGGGEDPVAIMLREHEEILSQLGLIEFYFEEGVPAAGEVAAFCAILSGTLAKHEHREETLLFPVWNSLLRGWVDSEGAVLLDRVQAVLDGGPG